MNDNSKLGYSNLSYIMSKQRNLMNVTSDECLKSFINNVDRKHGKRLQMLLTSSIETTNSSFDFQLLYFYFYSLNIDGIFNEHEI